MRQRIEITYCVQCRWLLRAAWMAQELLTTFEGRATEVALVPGSGGVFQIRINDQLVWCRAAQGGFPEIKQLKQLVRDVIAPDMDLGHSDRRTSVNTEVANTEVANTEADNSSSSIPSSKTSFHT